MLEASRRIELLYTDLQSLRFPNEINAVDAEKYQDKAGTGGEPDTRVKSDLTNENAANLAGFNGVKDVVNCVYLCGEYIATFPILATHWGALV
jgi:hypothetical protein